MLKRRQEAEDAEEGAESKRARIDDSDADASGSSPDRSLLAMLDFTHTTSAADIQTRFDEIASTLLRDHQLTVLHGGKVCSRYELIEVEFYLYQPGGHEDPFTHRSHEQQTAGEWYFHRAPRRSGREHPPQAQGSGYRGGTRKGLDLTIGVLPQARAASQHDREGLPADTERTAHTRGGILLRTMRRVSDGKVVSGPSLLVDEILRTSNAKSVADLVVTRLGGDTSAFSAHMPAPAPPPPHAAPSSNVRLRMERTQLDSGRSKLRVFRSPRIGLDLAHPEIPPDRPQAHPRVRFVARPYRYFVHPHLLTANGRGHTFLGVYRRCRGAGDEEDLREEIMRLTGLKARTAENYLAEYRFGLEKGQLKAFLGAAAKGASASPATFLRMMGTLDALGTSQ